jgi:hypothetical protein
MMTDQSELKPVLPSIPVGSPADQVLRESLKKMRNDADPQIRTLIDDILAGKRTMRDLAATEWFGRRVHEARIDFEAIQREAQKFQEDPKAADALLKKPE